MSSFPNMSPRTAQSLYQAVRMFVKDSGKADKGPWARFDWDLVLHQPSSHKCWHSQATAQHNPTMSQVPTRPAHYATSATHLGWYQSSPSPNSIWTPRANPVRRPFDSTTAVRTCVHSLDLCAPAFVSLYRQVHSPHPPGAWLSEEDNTALLPSRGPGA